MTILDACDVNMASTAPATAVTRARACHGSEGTGARSMPTNVAAMVANNVADRVMKTVEW
jgi:hypothetical protein